MTQCLDILMIYIYIIYIYINILYIYVYTHKYDMLKVIPAIFLLYLFGKS